MRRKWASVPGVVFPVERPETDEGVVVVTAPKKPKKPRAKVAAEPLTAPEGWITTAEACKVLGRAKLSTMDRMREAKVPFMVSRMKKGKGYLWQESAVLELERSLQKMPLLTEEEVGTDMMLLEVARKLGVAPSLVYSRMKRLGIEPRRVLVRRSSGGRVSKCQLLTQEQVAMIEQAPFVHRTRGPKKGQKRQYEVM